MGEHAVNDTRVWRAPDLPIRRWLPRYDRSALGKDLLAAAVVTALMIPQALGYAAIAGVPVQVGLYAIPLALLAYAVLGSSPHLFVGPVSTVSVVSGSLVAVHAGGDPQLAIAITVALALMSGLVLITAGLLRIGWVAEFLSKPIISGFVFGLSIVIIVGELPVLLGLPSVDGGTFARLAGIVTALPDVDPTTTLIGVASLVVLFVGGWWLPRLPWGLVLVVGAIVGSAQADLAGQGVDVVGSVPRGLPSPGVPAIPVSDVAALSFGAIGLALVGLAESLSAARLFATEGGYRIDADQEFVATGASNVASGLFGGLGVAGSLSKTAAAVRSGATSQVTGLAAAMLALAVLLVFAPSLRSLPRAVLAAVVIHAVWGLIDVPALRRYARIRRNDLVAAVAALIGVVVLGTLYGLLAAIALSVLGLVYRSGRVEVEVIGRIEGEKAAWGSVRRHPERRTIPGIQILRLSAPLFWVNAATVEDEVVARVDADPATRAVVLDLEATHQLDTTSADVFVSLLTRLRRRDVDVYVVRAMKPAREVMRRTGILEQLGDDHVWHTISAGVKEARRAHGIEGWADAAEPEVTADEERMASSHADEDPGPAPRGPGPIPVSTLPPRSGTLPFSPARRGDAPSQRIGRTPPGEGAPSPGHPPSDGTPGQRPVPSDDPAGPTSGRGPTG
jgi:sulfate permease, SulP family